MTEIKFKLNGNEVSVPKGWTIMQAATREKVAIPHFCWHEGLSIAGVCRFCMVAVEGRRKLEIACNTEVLEGMVVSTDTSEVKDAHKWTLEFHLVNHPLDCPICDQAGECGLQDYYMEVGQYKSQMTRPKVLKPKALDVGSELILDTERCILCSRCVRFEEEVTKTRGLGIFDRGDRAIIGTYNEEKITHHYQENIVDICPVGAFTSKKFRFKQRVWFLKEKESICPGCSTGCHINVHGKPETQRYFRIKPQHSEVNGHWMCDTGRRMVDHMNPEERLNVSWYLNESGRRISGTSSEGIHALAKKLQQTDVKKIALLVSAQYTSEEYASFFSFFVKSLGIKNVFQWREPTEKIADFDGILLRGDMNANTKGLQEQMKKAGLEEKSLKNELDACLASKPEVLLALSPEVPLTFPSLAEHLQKIQELPFVSLWTTHFSTSSAGNFSSILPMKGFAEKRGSFLNFEGKVGKLEHPFPSAVVDALDIAETVQRLQQAMASLQAQPQTSVGRG